MNFLPIYSTLKDDADVAALIDVETKLYEDIAPVGTESPYIVWQALSGVANQHLDEPANFDDILYQIMVYSTDAKQAYQIRKAVRTALEGKSWILNPSINRYEYETRLFVRGFDANWILER